MFCIFYKGISRFSLHIINLKQLIWTSRNLLAQGAQMTPVTWITPFCFHLQHFPLSNFSPVRFTNVNGFLLWSPVWRRVCRKEAGKGESSKGFNKPGTKLQNTMQAAMVQTT